MAEIYAGERKHGGSVRAPHGGTTRVRRRGGARPHRIAVPCQLRRPRSYRTRPGSLPDPRATSRRSTMPTTPPPATPRRPRRSSVGGIAVLGILVTACQAAHPAAARSPDPLLEREGRVDSLLSQM